MNLDVLNVIKSFAWALFLLLICITALQYFFQINIKTMVNNLFNGDINGGEMGGVMGSMGGKLGSMGGKLGSMGGKMGGKMGSMGSQMGQLGSNGGEVFHIGDNVYTYNEAKILCNAHEGELASYEQMENAYHNGAEWCSFGWSKDQMALYPTQKATYNTLKGIPGQENSCGRPGVNGGFIKNAHTRFGVNCFASKNKPSNLEKQVMNSSTIIPTLPNTENNKKINFYKKNIHRIVKKPFNSNKWSSF
jgi:hypothetical protein